MLDFEGVLNFEAEWKKAITNVYESKSNGINAYCLNRVSLVHNSWWMMKSKLIEEDFTFSKMPPVIL